MYYHFSILGIILIFYILFKVKNKLFSEVKSFLWVLGGIIVFLLPFNVELLHKLAIFLSVDYIPSLLFLLSIIFIFFIIFRQEQDVSGLNEKVKELAQKNAILEEKVRVLSK